MQISRSIPRTLVLLLVAATSWQAYARQGADPNVPTPQEISELPDSPPPTEESPEMRARRNPDATQPRPVRTAGSLPEIALVGRVLVNEVQPAGLLRIDDQFHLVRLGAELSVITGRNDQALILTIVELSAEQIRITVAPEGTDTPRRTVILR